MTLELIINIILAILAAFGAAFTIYQEIRHHKTKTIKEVEDDLESYINMINRALTAIKRIHFKK